MFEVVFEIPIPIVFRDRREHDHFVKTQARVRLQFPNDEAHDRLDICFRPRGEAHHKHSPLARDRVEVAFVTTMLLLARRYRFRRH